MKQHTLTEPQKRVVEALQTAGRPLTVGEIVEAIGVKYSWTSRIVDQVVALGLAEKRTRPDNGKFREVSLLEQTQTPAPAA
jgi:DNA-binding MarR family transcriptional regulator